MLEILILFLKLNNPHIEQNVVLKLLLIKPETKYIK